MTLTVHTRTFPAAVPRLKRDRKPIKIALRESAKKVARTTRASIRRQRGRPSRPGQAPASQTGALKKSVRFRLDRSGLAARVGATAPHAAMLEAGTKSRRRRRGGRSGKLAPRPFLGSALATHRPDIVSDVSAAVRDALRWAR